MAIYEVYASKNPELTRFVRDKGSIFALILPALWLVWNRLWFALAVYLCVVFFFVAIGNTQWAMIVSVFSFLPGLYLFLEGPNLVGSKCQRSGLEFSGVIEADSRDSAELKWFSKQDQTNLHMIGDKPQNFQSAISHQVMRPASDKADFGLFAEE